MSFVKLPNTREYWSSSAGIPLVAKSWRSIASIKEKNINFNGNATTDKVDKITKVCPLWNKLHEKARAVPMEEWLAVDEQIFSFKGRDSVKQYDPKKHINESSKCLI